jgi:hypothetical protein
MRNETQQELIAVADKLYREQNPQSNMCTPNDVYITVLEKWYPKYLISDTDLPFYDWCIKTYGGKDEKML